MKRFIIVCLAAFVISPVFADDYAQIVVTGTNTGGSLFDENSLFSDTGMMVSMSNIEDEGILTNEPPLRVQFSGVLRNRDYHTMSRDWLQGETNTDLNRFSASMEGNVLLDLRLRSGFRGYANFSFGYYPMGSTTYATIMSMLGVAAAMIDESQDALLKKYLATEVGFKEAFVDFNISQAVYFRLGKQVLQWGRNYFWNPTDLLNVEQKDFFNMTDYRDGAMGLKVHVPFGTVVNLYGFVDVGDEEHFGDFGVAGKAEFLIGGFEFAFSAWAKKGYLPVYGFDFSTRLLTFDIRGELAMSYGDNRPKLDGNGQEFSITNEWIPRASFGFTRSFDLLGVSDRFTLIGEVYYNHSGYYENVFDNTAMKTALFANNLYRMNDNSVYYAALFTSISKFIVSDMTFTLNAIGNFNDYSFVVTGGLSYEPVYNYSISLSVSGFLGEDDCEYTFSGTGIATQLIFSINF